MSDYFWTRIKSSKFIIYSILYIFCLIFRVIYPKKLTEVVEADQHQRLLLRFIVKDTVSGKGARIHQAFVKITHMQSKKEIIFVAEADSSDIYKFDMVRTFFLGFFCH